MDYDVHQLIKWKEDGSIEQLIRRRLASSEDVAELMVLDDWFIEPKVEDWLSPEVEADLNQEIKAAVSTAQLAPIMYSLIQNFLARNLQKSS